MKWCAALLFFLCWAGAATHAAEPSQTEVGAYISGVHSFDEVGGSFGINTMLWWKTRDPSFQPFAELQVLNARSWTTSAVTRRELPDGTIYWSGFVAATLNEVWEFENYPFDTQHLQIAIETGKTNQELQLTTGKNNLVLGQFTRIPGFAILDTDLTVSAESYPSSFGLDAAATSTYPRLTLRIDIQRDGWALLLVSIIGFIVAMTIASILHLVPVDLLSVRVTMIASCIFASVGNTYLIVNNTHPVSGSAFIDHIALGAFCATILALLSSIGLAHLASTGRAELATRMNRISLAIVAGGSFSIVVLALIMAKS